MKTPLKLTPEDIVIPVPISTTEFRRAWFDWLQHLREAGKRPTTVYARQALDLLATLPADSAVYCLTKAVQLCRTYFDVQDVGRPTPMRQKESMTNHTDKLFGGNG